MQSQAKFSVLSRPTSCLSIVFHRVKRQRRLGLSFSARYMKFTTTCVDLIKINFVCETGSNPQTALDLSNPGCSLVLLLKSHKSCHDDGWSRLNWWGRRTPVNVNKRTEIWITIVALTGIVLRVRSSGFLTKLYSKFSSTQVKQQIYIFQTTTSQTSLPKRFLW